MKNILIAAAAVLMTTMSAQALTIKSGQVLTTDADGNSVVMNAGETESAKRNLENKGYHVGGGSLFVKIEDVTIEVSLDEFVGLTKEQQRDLLRVEIGKELGVDYVVGDITEQDVVDGVLDETIGHDTALFDATEAALDAYEEKVNDFINDPDGVNSEAIADGHTPEVCAGGPCSHH